MTADTESRVAGFRPAGARSFGTREELLADLERAISSGRIPPGEKLPSERELGLDYRLSRPVVREALRGLAERGYIEVFPGRGSFVRAPESADLSAPLVRIATSVGVTPRHLVGARDVIEVGAARAAATRADDARRSALSDLLRAHEKASSLVERARTDLAFHEAIVAASGNPLLELMYGSISTFVLGVMLRSHSDPDVHRVGDPIHAAILQAILDQDGDAAAAAMKEHISLALQLYGDDLDRPLVEVLGDRGIHV